ncbi:hypothetical protein [Pseudobacillus wudalianchiensis]|nr:hypothetical protein [Bacillus wudalianchiensis]
MAVYEYQNEAILANKKTDDEKIEDGFWKNIGAFLWKDQPFMQGSLC